MTRMLSAALALVLSAPALASGDAVIAKASGSVFLLAEGAKKSVPVKGGESILYGDSVRTGAGGLAQVVFAGDRGGVLIRENSSFTLRGTPQKTLLDFRIGEFLIGVKKKLAAGESFRVRTPAAVAAVRGTLFWGKSEQDKSVTYAGFGHTIAVTAQGKTVVVRAGETTTVAMGEAPLDPTAHSIPLSYADNFKIDGSLQGLEALVDMPAK